MFSVNNYISNIKINDIYLGDNADTYIIAEIGINHNGDISIAKKLIDMAVYCGCDAVKFQKKSPDICVPDTQKNIIKETPWGTMTYLEYKNRLEFSLDDFCIIDDYCKKKKMTWFASVWDEISVDFIKQFKPPCYKIPSACLTDNELIKYVSNQNKPIMLSTGMSNMKQIEHAVNIIKDKHLPLIIMHCNSSYPILEEKYNMINLNMIKTLREWFNCHIGYSGHEVGLLPSILAVLTGAICIERHITLDRAMWGTDQSSSLEPLGLKRLIRDIRLIPSIMGDGVKKITDDEKKIMDKLRRYK